MALFFLVRFDSCLMKPYFVLLSEALDDQIRIISSLQNGRVATISRFSQSQLFCTNIAFIAT